MGLCSYPILAFGFNMNAALAEAVGRDPTFTERTDIWRVVLSQDTNPLVGTGYESFWLGSRLQAIWSTHVGAVNEAHDGYLEVYLNLGLVGLVLLVGFLLSSYRSICRGFTPASRVASLAMGTWAAMLFYNITEAAFRFHFMWVAFLAVAITVPAQAEGRAQDGAASNEGKGQGAVTMETPLLGPYEPAPWWN